MRLDKCRSRARCCTADEKLRQQTRPRASTNGASSLPTLWWTGWRDLACVDIVRGQSIDPFSFITVAVIAACLPLVVQQLVEIELVERRSVVLNVLTGCLNRHSFEQRSAKLMPRHAAGNHVLEDASHVAGQQLRRFALMLRLGVAACSCWSTVRKPHR